MGSKDSARNTDALLKKDDTPSRRKYKELFDDSDDEDSDIECELCSKSFPSFKAYEQHVNGKKHHQMLSKKKLMKKIKPTNGEENENIDPDSADELQCDVCEKTFSGYKPYISHMKGGIHAKTVKQQKLKESLKDKPEVLAKNGDEVEPDEDDLLLLEKPFARCSTCEKVFYDPFSYKKHMSGSTHKKKMVQQRTLNGLKNEFRDDPQVEDDEFFTKCDVCNKRFSGPVPFKIHLKSAVHENQLKRVKAMEKLKDFFEEDPDTGKMICKECKKMYTDPFSFKQHLDNNSHEKKNVKDQVLEFVAANPEIAAMKSIQSISSGDESDENGEYEKGYYFLVCKLCHMSFTGLESAKDHVQSKKHISAKIKKKHMKLLKSRMEEKKDDHTHETSKNMNGQVKNALAASKRTTASSEIDAQSADGNDDFELV